MTDPSSSVTAYIVNVGIRRVEAAAKKQEYEEAKKKAYAAEKELQDALEAGGTTDDWLRDQVIRAWGLQPALEAAYRQVNDQLTGHKGELILLTFDYDKRMPERWLRGEDYQLTTYYRLGVLVESRLVLHPPQRPDGSPMLGVPVFRFIEGEKEPYPNVRKLQIVNQELFGQLHQDRDPPNFMMYVSEKSGDNHARAMFRPTNVELVVGNKAVAAWLKAAGMQDLYTPAAHVLGMLELQPTDAA